MIIAISIIAIVGAMILYSCYVSVVKNANTAREALSGIDVQLRKRYDLIPNVLTIAKKFMEHENDLFEKIVMLRTQAHNCKSGTKEKFEAEAQLDAQMKSLMVNVENYPQLKSDETMLQAMRTYNEVEENISAARRFYNSALTQLRNSIQIFPGSLFASCAGDTSDFSYFETDPASKAPIDASKYL